ncbi:hypothetical protein [Gemmatimonas groenlandica]|uniref:Lipoprotein n=1 Tax=Gemmatimonas groenlandica TaxID=2732249 RepID=A0A6M4IWC4_9BACT|nr:hypothetical protein [Gemmatimonas groenlandica]QJR37836.1 hypothetical protein HKW67_21070 [Gemmatimonas groenlandica]
MTLRTPLFILAASVAAMLAACAGDTAAPTSANAALLDSHGAHVKSLTGALTVEQKQGIALARNGTARFHNFKAAEDAGYSIQFPAGCAVDASSGPDDPSEGAQAYHYMNKALVDDGVIDLEHPELLMYEPQKNGSLQLVGVDYVVPRTFPKPAPLLGMEFVEVNVQGAEVWALHIWAWRPNSNGTFYPWNPAVSCKYQFQD